jgi:hypothetical protein
MALLPWPLIHFRRTVRPVVAHPRRHTPIILPQHLLIRDIHTETGSVIRSTLSRPTVRLRGIRIGTSTAVHHHFSRTDLFHKGPRSTISDRRQCQARDPPLPLRQCIMLLTWLNRPLG